MKKNYDPKKKERARESEHNFFQGGVCCLV
jgi:hypothetical protein